MQHTQAPILVTDGAVLHSRDSFASLDAGIQLPLAGQVSVDAILARRGSVRLAANAVVHNPLPTYQVHLSAALTVAVGLSSRAGQAINASSDLPGVVMLSSGMTPALSLPSSLPALVAADAPIRLNRTTP